MWNVGLYDLHAISKRGHTTSVYHDCAHLKNAGNAYALYDRLVDMLKSLRAKVFARNASELCLSRRCHAHNEAVSPPGAPLPESYDFGGDLPGLAGGGEAGAPLPQGGLTEDGRRRRLSLRTRLRSWSWSLGTLSR
jgi:hypothetical protein